MERDKFLVSLELDLVKFSTIIKFLITLPVNPCGLFFAVVVSLFFVFFFLSKAILNWVLIT